MLASPNDAGIRAADVTQHVFQNGTYTHTHAIKYLPSELYTYVRCDDHDIDLVFRNVLWAWLNVKYLNFG